MCNGLSNIICVLMTFWHCDDIILLYDFSYSFVFIYTLFLYFQTCTVLLGICSLENFVVMHLFSLHWNCWYNWIGFIAECHTQKWKAKQKKFKLLKHDETKILCILTLLWSNILLLIGYFVLLVIKELCFTHLITFLLVVISNVLYYKNSRATYNVE